MLSLFKKRSKAEKLEIQYRKMIEEAHKLSTVNRTLSDKKYAQAQAILDQIPII